jgi:hypothetical protein
MGCLGLRRMGIHFDGWLHGHGCPCRNMPDLWRGHLYLCSRSTLTSISGSARRSNACRRVRIQTAPSAPWPWLSCSWGSRFRNQPGIAVGARIIHRSYRVKTPILQSAGQLVWTRLRSAYAHCSFQGSPQRLLSKPARLLHDLGKHVLQRSW